MTNKFKKKKRKLRKWVVLTLLAIIIAASSFVGIQYYSFQNALSKMNSNEEGEILPVVDKEIITDPFSVLLLGIDERDNDTGRSDTMIVLTVNPKLNTVKMLSIPRDTRTEIIGNNTTEKINHAYARGGVDMSIDTVEALLDIPIDYHVTVNMEGFLSVIDTIGGITINNDMDLTFRTYHFPQGEVTLSGEEALVFSRIRYEDPRGDWGRQIRQRQLIEALMAEAKNPQILLELKEIFSVLGDNIRTNFTMNEIKALPQLYVQLDKNIQQMSFDEGHGETINGLWYYIVDETELTTIQQTLLTHLGEEPLTTTQNQQY
jgi:polyisoprenyl-teichoic acid--peptidoglycan teichoic acid transferase